MLNYAFLRGHRNSSFTRAALNDMCPLLDESEVHIMCWKMACLFSIALFSVLLTVEVPYSFYFFEQKILVHVNCIEEPHYEKWYCSCFDDWAESTIQSITQYLVISFYIIPKQQEDMYDYKH